jgi:VanZ family protein
VAAWVAVIFALSSDQFSDVHTARWLSSIPWVAAVGMSPAAIEAGNLIVRKCAHFVEYAVLGLLVFRALRATWPGPTRRRLVVAAIVIGGLVAGLDELRQHFETQTRTGTPRDVALDGLGAVAGSLLGASLLMRRVAPP